MLNTNNLQLYGIKYSNIWIVQNRYIWTIHGTGATTLGQCGPGSNGNNVELHTPQSYRTGVSSSNVVKYQNLYEEVLTPLLGNKNSGF